MNQSFRAITNWLGLILLVLLVLIYFGFPVAMGIAAVSPAKQVESINPEGSIPVNLTTEDGLSLSGWYVPPQNGTAVIMLHGAGGSVYDLEPYAAMLERNGYGVLAVDLRGHGSSEGKTNRLGWQGTKDVGAAVRYLKDQPDVRHIAGFGLSMGAEVLLGATSTYPEIEAICADGASRRSLEELLGLESERPLVRNFTARIMYATVNLLSGEEAPLPLLDSMEQSETTRFLLIAVGNNELEVAFNRLFEERLNGRADLNVFLGVEHTDAFYSFPKEYEEVVINFFSILSE